MIILDTTVVSELMACSVVIRIKYSGTLTDILHRIIEAFAAQWAMVAK